MDPTCFVCLLKHNNLNPFTQAPHILLKAARLKVQGLECSTHPQVSFTHLHSLQAFPSNTQGALFPQSEINTVHRHMGEFIYIYLSPNHCTPGQMCTLCIVQYFWTTIVDGVQIFIPVIFFLNYYFYYKCNHFES